MAIDLKKLAEVAIKAARNAGSIIMDHYNKDLDVEIKDNISPLVSKVDRQSEITIRQIIRKSFKDHIIIGEEYPDDIPEDDDHKSSQLTWIIDPLDGTTAYLAGLPTFTVLIGVWEGDSPVLGVIYQPMTDQLWIGGPNYPTRLNGIKCKPKLNNRAKILATSGLHYLGPEALRILEQEKEKADHITFGGDGLLYGLLASGKISTIVEDSLAWHDIAACIPVILGARGIVTNLNGKTIKPGLKNYALIARSENSVKI